MCMEVCPLLTLVKKDVSRSSGKSTVSSSKKLGGMKLRLRHRPAVLSPNVRPWRTRTQTSSAIEPWKCPVLYFPNDYVWSLHSSSDVSVSVALHIWNILTAIQQIAEHSVCIIIDHLLVGHTHSHWSIHSSHYMCESAASRLHRESSALYWYLEFNLQ